MIYKIDDIANLDHDKQCLIVETTKTKEEMLLILVGIQFHYEKLVDESGCIIEAHLLDILEQFYGVKDVKDKYKEYLTQMRLPDEEWGIFNEFEINGDLVITQIDLYNGRESMCIKSDAEKATEALPKGKAYSEFVEMLLKAPEYEKNNEDDIVEDDIDEFYPEPEEVGLAFMIKSKDGKELFIGSNGSKISGIPPEFGYEYEFLNNLEFFKNDSNETLSIVNELRDQGIDARVLYLFRYEGTTFVSNDETETYLKNNLIVELRD